MLEGVGWHNNLGGQPAHQEVPERHPVLALGDGTLQQLARPAHIRLGLG